MDWKQYSLAFVLFGVVNIGVLYLALRCQGALPWFFPSLMTMPVTPDLAANTAVSFVTTTTWQAYSGETTLSYFSQLLLVGQNFPGGAAGLAVGVAFVRGYVREGTSCLGNFWVDLVRALLWVLLPLFVLGSVFLIAQGVPMNFLPPTILHTVGGETQTIAQGPVAAMEFIKNLGTSGGGFFNANGAHPFENPTPLANLVELLAIVVIPAAFTHTFGRMVGRPRDGWVIFWTMTAVFVAGYLVCSWSESHPSPAWAATVSGGNLEGKETRFGVDGSVLAAVVTSNGATGSYNAMHDSLMAGLSANSIFCNVTTIVAMLVGRWRLAILALALAGRFAVTTRRPPSLGTAPTDDIQFGLLLAAVAILVGALNFLPALALGPVLEHFVMRQ